MIIETRFSAFYKTIYFYYAIFSQKYSNCPIYFFKIYFQVFLYNNINFYPIYEF